MSRVGSGPNRTGGPSGAHPAPSPHAPLPFERFRGTAAAVGRAHGEAHRDLVHQHLALVRGRLAGGPAGQAMADVVRPFRRWVRRYSPHLDEEIVGLSQGAGIALDDAYLLQLRAEANAAFHRMADEGSNECTTFGLEPAVTASGRGMIGQNADLPAYYQDLMVVSHVQSGQQPDVLMVHPAGQVSYVGINNDGMGVAANFLLCDGWRTGFPRYLFTRVALGAPSVRDAIGELSTMTRASSRNLILIGADGRVVGLENTPTVIERLPPTNGVLTHANHYLSPALLTAERVNDRGLANSRARQGRIDALIEQAAAPFTVAAMANIMRDRVGAPDALSRTLADVPASEPVAGRPSGTITATAFIAEPTSGAMWVCAGPPSESTYYRYSFDHGCHRDRTL